MRTTLIIPGSGPIDNFRGADQPTGDEDALQMVEMAFDLLGIPVYETVEAAQADTADPASDFYRVTIEKIDA